MSEVELDMKDKRILFCLAENSRATISEISKKVSLSRTAVENRIEGYEKKGIIEGYRAFIDVPKFGYMNYHIFLQLYKPSTEIEEHIATRMSRDKNIRAVMKFHGKYDFEIAMIAKNDKELEKQFFNIINRCGDTFDYENLIITKNYNLRTLPRSFFDGDLLTTKKEIKYEPDEKDVILLKELAENCRRPIHEFGKILNLKTDTVIYRMKKLFDSGYIVKYFSAINFSKLGYSFFAIMLDIDSFNESDIVLLKGFFEKDMNTIWAARAIGKYNTIFYLAAKNVRDIMETVKNLRNTFPGRIKNFETLILEKRYKYTYLPVE